MDTATPTTSVYTDITTQPVPWIEIEPHTTITAQQEESRENSRIAENINMMTSSNGNIFRVTGPLCGEFTGPGEFPTQRPVTRSFDVFFDLRLNKRLSKQPRGWWFETPPWSLWRRCNEKATWKSNSLTYKTENRDSNFLVIFSLNTAHRAIQKREGVTHWWCSQFAMTHDKCSTCSTLPQIRKDGIVQTCPVVHLKRL